MTAPLLSTRQLIALAITAAIVFGVVFAIVLPASHTVALDVAVASWVAAHRSAAATVVFQAISTCGSVFGIVPIAVVIAIVLRRTRASWRPVAWLAATMAGATAIYLAFNVWIERARPPLGLRLHAELGWSFPSGHSTQSLAFWFMTAILLTEGRALRVRVGARLAAAAIVLATGASRIYLGAHWTTDVCSGFALGGCWLSCMLAAMRIAELRRARAATG